jgi:hypothetical protein
LNSISSADLRSEFAHIDKFDSLLGPVTWKDHKTQRPLSIVRLHDKEATPVKKLE